MNNSTKIKIFSWSIITIFLAVIFHFIAGIGSQIHSGNDIAKYEFSRMVDTITQFEKNNKFMSSEYINNVNKLISSNPAICATIIQSNNTPVYAYPLSSKIIVADKDGNPYLSVSSPMVKIFTYSLKNTNSNTTIITAMYLVKPNDIYKFTRTSFIIILAATLIALLGLLAMIIIPKKESDENIIVKDDPSDENDAFLEDLFDDTDTSNNNDEQNVNITPPLDTQNEKIIEEEETENSDYSDPLEVFSSNTGFCHEKDLEMRLDTELSKAASAEYDLSLLLLQIKDLNHSDINIKLVCTALQQIYNLKELIFEYKNDAFAILFLNTNLDDAMLLAEKIYKAEQSILSKNKLTNKIGLGLSTRSIRIIPSSRLLLEAQQALDKSYEETELPIVAFKVDPEKYRQRFK